ncbi:hypothetical protein CAPTEDRAFT_194980 [Capitella teleta]|uniref:Ras-associating domain-containing protein n=1 Tax=Capitella teleta TaxID=283909 RepID=R7VKZ9_CAPTE|nr:hypothetical protein CAPTEDRAFT_194980 [Capitella teleta]|eukprot:ELU17841.1 hypothetical protein CAPTEDRAFT_194980 [Capitella teleta]
MQVSSGSERDSLTVEGDTLLKITVDFECMCKEEKGTKVFYSVVLAYIGNALCRDSKSVVKRAALGCFTSEEIHDAKVELWSKSSASVIGSCPLRRGSQQRSRADFEVEDIIDAFESLDKEDCSTNRLEDLERKHCESSPMPPPTQQPPQTPAATNPNVWMPGAAQFACAENLGYADIAALVASTRDGPAAEAVCQGTFATIQKAVNLGRFLLLKSRLFEDIYGLYGKSKMMDGASALSDHSLAMDAELDVWLNQLTAIQQEPTSTPSKSSTILHPEPLETISLIEQEHSSLANLDSILGDLCELESTLNCQQSEINTSLNAIHSKPSLSPDKSHLEDLYSEDSLGELDSQLQSALSQLGDFTDYSSSRLSVSTARTSRSSFDSVDASFSYVNKDASFVSDSDSVSTISHDGTQSKPVELKNVLHSSQSCDSLDFDRCETQSESSETDVHDRLEKFQLELEKGGLTLAEQQVKMKEEKVRLALEKLKDANIKKLFVRAHTTDGSSKSILVDEEMTVAEIVEMLISKNHATPSVKWSIVEQLPDLHMGPNIMKKNVERLFTGIRHELQVVFTKFWSLGNSLVSDVGAFNDYLIKFSIENDPEKIIIRDNMVNLNIYYKDLNCRKVRQKPAYDILAFFSDFGGYMGLLLGASVVSIIELFDWCLYRCLFQRKIQSLISTVQVRSRAIYPHSEINDRVLSRMSNVCMAKERVHQERTLVSNDLPSVTDGGTNFNMPPVD